MLRPTFDLFQMKAPFKSVRFKNPPHHWSVLRKKDIPTQKALNHFDDFYKQVYDNKWLTIRKALLGEKKYVAVINNFGDCDTQISNMEKLGALNIRKLFQLRNEKYLHSEISYNENILNESKQKLNNIHPKELSMKFENTNKLLELDETNLNIEITTVSHNNFAQLNTNRLVDVKDALSSTILQEFIPTTKIKGKEDFIPESSNYKLYDTNSDLGVKIAKEYDLNYPEHLKVYCFEKENYSKFHPPKKDITGVYNYYLMDGGSILPVLALDVKPGNRVLDMCASPGGKSLLCIQTLYPISVVSNDISQSRLNKVHGAYEQFLFDFSDKWVKPGKILLTNLDGRFIPEGSYDRILVDAPCSTDRHSVNENDNNIFKASRVKERLQIPVMQRELLVNALKLIKVGGIVVYSTCSLNPIENEGVVHMALKQIWEETNMDFVVKDMNPALKQTRDVFHFSTTTLQYGHLVIPTISQNYGPTYFCKFQKIS